MTAHEATNNRSGVRISSNPQRPEEFSARYACEVAATANARSDLHAWLQSRLDADALVHDVIVVLSELLANACAASDSPQGSLLVRACLDDETLVLEVANRSSQRSKTAKRADHTDPLRGQGRGLVIAKALMDVVEVDRENDWTVMRCKTSTLA